MGNGRVYTCRAAAAWAVTAGGGPAVRRRRQGLRDRGTCGSRRGRCGGGGGPGATAALKSPGPVSRERRSSQQWARLEAELRRSPLAHGFADDQRWTLSRIKTLIRRLFHVGYTVEGTWKLLRGHGWSCRRMERPNRARFRAGPSV